MNCLFCNFATGEIPVERVLENDLAFSIKDINPVAPTHFLVIPKAHHENAADLARHAPDALVAIFQLAAQLAEQEGLSGYRAVFNTGASAGQSVFHAHLHLISGRPLSWPPG